MLVVPQHLRDASLSVGANQSQTIFKIVLPCAVPGILTGVLLGIGRVIGESAALIYTMGTFINDSPTLLSQGTSLAVQIWSIMSGEQPNYELACAISIIILFFVLDPQLCGQDHQQAILKGLVLGGSIMENVIFDVKNLNLFYGEKQALIDLNMQIEKNAITALIGPSGCGKSTFLRCLNRMNDLIDGCRVEGDIRMEGKDIYKGGWNVVDLRTHVGMVFQKPNPFPMSIYDNIAYGPRCQGIKDKKTLNQIVEQSLQRAALWEEVKDRLKDSAYGLSGGQQQRLCIARAIAMEPEVILMDEPTSALDPISTNKIEELATELKNDYTIVIVTHNMQQAARVSDYTAFFLLGEMVEFDKTSVIFQNPSDKRTEDYITGRFG